MEDSQKAGRLTAITLENFRGIGKAVKIDLKPLTLLFGPNSAGKSSILKALRVMKDSLGRDKKNDSVRSLIHKCDNDSTMRIRIEMAIDEFEFRTPDTYASIDAKYYLDDLIHLEHVWVEIVFSAFISKQEAEQSPVYSPYVSPTEFAVGINGIEIARIRQNLPREIGSDYNPISHFTELPVLINTSHQVFSKLYDEYMQVTEGAVNETGEWRLSYLDDYSSFEIRKSDDADSFAFSYLMPGCIPAFDKYPSLSLNEKHDSEMTALEINMSVVILQLLFGGRDIALKVLEDIRQIGPLREIPAMDFNNGSGTLCWMNGSYAWKLLADPDANDSYESETHVLPSDSALIEAVSSVLEKLKTGFSLQLLKISSVDVSSSSGIKERLEQAIGAAESDAPEDIAAAIQRLLNNSPQSRDVLLKDTVQDVVLYPQDAAMGIVQLVPVVVAMLVGGTNVCSIEQPELHLHPAVQCELGSFFAESIKANRERLALIETHSEHMLLRFQRLIRDKIMSHDDISVVSFTRTPAGSLVTNLRINESGEFLDEWPGGFFEESFNEMFGDGQC